MAHIESDPAIYPNDRGVLTIIEVAAQLRCSKAHVHHLINGAVRGARPLPCLRVGRRRLVRRVSLEEWIKATEKCYDPITPEFIAKAHGKD